MCMPSSYGKYFDLHFRQTIRYFSSTKIDSTNLHNVITFAWSTYTTFEKIHFLIFTEFLKYFLTRKFEKFVKLTKHFERITKNAKNVETVFLNVDPEPSFLYNVCAQSVARLPRRRRRDRAKSP